MSIPPIISVGQLSGLDKDFVLVDASNNPLARANYESGHLKGALFVDANSQLARPSEDASNGGRHPLPSPEAFSIVLSELGISPHSRVVIYDDKNGANAAARFWWMLKAAGHQEVQVLDGGLSAAQKAGYPMASGSSQPQKSRPYVFGHWELPLSDMAEVRSATQNNGKIIIDVRESARYNGMTEPIDLIAGHIPGAVNIPFTENLDVQGFFLGPEELRIKYAALLKYALPQNTIVHCGSGVTACHTILAMAHAGMEMPKLYVGSWSEWSRNGLPMVTPPPK